MKTEALTPSTNRTATTLLEQAGRISRTMIPALWVLLGFSLAAQTNAPAPAASSGAFKTDFLWGNTATNRLRLGAFVDYSYVASGDVNYYGAKGQSAAQSVNVYTTGEIPLKDQWYLPLGVGFGNIWLDSVFGAPIPDQINTLHLNAGLGRHINDQWTVSASVGPVLYALHDIKSDDIGFLGSVRAVYRARPNLVVTFGLAVNPDSEIPVFPSFGARWDVRTNLTLNLMFPKPGVIYRAAPNLNLFVGGGLSGATFRTDDQMANRTGLNQFNRALGNYWDFHLGTGLEYEVIRRLSVSLEGGYSLGRRLDYTRLDETVRFDPGPYVQAGLRYRF